MARNKVVITCCTECANWLPADSYGCGTYCEELNRVVHEPNSGEDLIPDCCPLLAKNKE